MFSYIVFSVYLHIIYSAVKHCPLHTYLWYYFTYCLPITHCKFSPLVNLSVTNAYLFALYLITDIHKKLEQNIN